MHSGGRLLRRLLSLIVHRIPPPGVHPARCADLVSASHTPWAQPRLRPRAGSPQPSFHPEVFTQISPLAVQSLVLGQTISRSGSPRFRVAFSFWSIVLTKFATLWNCLVYTLIWHLLISIFLPPYLKVYPISPISLPCFIFFTYT